MIIRPIQPDEVTHLRELHEKYYSEYEFPDLSHFLASYIIEDNDSEIVLASGVEAIGECVLITNQKQSRAKLGRAFVQAQEIALEICRRSGIHELHAFTNNQEWARHLKMHGFSERSPAYSMMVPNNGQK